MNKPIISLTFDDGWKSAVENALPILEDAKVKATFYIISNATLDRDFHKDDVSFFRNYMNVRDIEVLRSNGHEIGAHTRNHFHLPQISLEEAEEEIIGGKRDLVNAGFNAETFSYPYGESNDEIIKIVTNGGFKAARSTISGFNDTDTDPYLLKCQCVKEDTSIEEVSEWINIAEGGAKWLILMFHQINAADELKTNGAIWGTTPQILKEIISYTKSRSIEIVPVAEQVSRL